MKTYCQILPGKLLIEILGLLALIAIPGMTVAQDAPPPSDKLFCQEGSAQQLPR
jgi:hypothetical protein